MPGKEKRTQIPASMLSEQAMFIACLHLTVRDALGDPIASAPRERADLVAKARAYLCFSPELDVLAALAGIIDGDRIREWAHAQRRNGWHSAVAHPESFLS